MKIVLAVILLLVAWVVVWPLVKMLIALTFGIIHLAVLALVVIFIIGLVQRLLRA